MGGIEEGRKGKEEREQKRGQVQRLLSKTYVYRYIGELFRF